MYAGSPFMRFGVVGGRGVLHPGFKKGYGRRKRRDFYHLVGERDAIFLALRALSFLALRCYPVCGFPLNPTYLI